MFSFYILIDALKLFQMNNILQSQLEKFPRNLKSLKLKLLNPV